MFQITVDPFKSDQPEEIHLWPSLCRMVVLETRQVEDQSGLSNLYLLDVAEKYVLLQWCFGVTIPGTVGELPAWSERLRCRMRTNKARRLWASSVHLTGIGAALIWPGAGEMSGQDRVLTLRRRDSALIYAPLNFVWDPRVWRFTELRKPYLTSWLKPEKKSVFLPQYYWSQRPAETDRLPQDSSFRGEKFWPLSCCVLWPELVRQCRINCVVVTL